MDLEFVMDASANKKTSSAKRVWEIKGPWEVIGIRVKKLLATWLWMSIESNCIPNINGEGDKGSPCLTP